MCGVYFLRITEYFQIFDTKHTHVHTHTKSHQTDTGMHTCMFLRVCVARVFVCLFSACRVVVVLTVGNLRITRERVTKETAHWEIG